MMHNLTLFLTACFFTLLMSQPSSAQGANNSPNQLAVEAMSEMLNVFNAAATANSPSSARVAAGKINKHTDRLVALTPLLAKSKKPSDAEMRKFAEFVLQNNTQIRNALKSIAVLRESNSEETNSIIKGAMDKMSSKTQPLTSAINNLYPTKKMKVYIEEAKKKASN